MYAKCFLFIAAFKDQFDCIDLSDNDIRKVEGFPYLRRLKTLLFNNNRISLVFCFVCFHEFSCVAFV